MARGRMIDKRISKSNKLAALKRDRARVLYFMIYPHLDCEGRFSGDPRDIKEDCCPRLPYSLRQIAEAVIDLDHVRLLTLYEVEGRPYIDFSRFEDFQSLRKDREAESEIPPYSGVGPESARTTPALYLSLSLSLYLSKEEERTAPTMIQFCFKSKKFLNITESDKERWGRTYPACDIEREILKMEDWLIANPKKAPRSNYRQFIRNWLNREQNSGGTRGGLKPTPKKSATERLKELEQGRK